MSSIVNGYTLNDVGDANSGSVEKALLTAIVNLLPAYGSTLAHGEHLHHGVASDDGTENIFVINKTGGEQRGSFVGANFAWGGTVNMVWNSGGLLLYDNYYLSLGAVNKGQIGTDGTDLLMLGCSGKVQISSVGAILLKPNSASSGGVVQIASSNDLKLGRTAVTGTATPNGYVQVKDAAGSTCLIPCQIIA